MARTRIKTPANLSDPSTKRRLMTAISTLHGDYDISITPAGPKRSSQANRYFHGPVVNALYDYLNAPGHGDGVRHYSEAQCKDAIVTKVFGTEPFIDPNTGEQFGETRRSTAEMDDETFSILIEKGKTWLEEQFGIVVPEPSVFYGDAVPERTGA